MTGEALLQLASLLGHRTGEGTLRTYEAGLRRAAPELGLSAEELLRRALAGERRCLDAVVSHVTVGETYLFRNPEHFELASAHARRAAAAGRPVRSAWSVGCASGEEAWSLAHALSPAAPSARVVGTDVSPRALALARRGHYGSWSFRNIRPERLGWEREGAGWKVPERLRAMVSFQEANLAAQTLTPPLELGLEVDVVFCRNVLLYFSAPAAARVMRALVTALSEGGLLVLGALEVPSLLPEGLERLTEGDGCAFVRRSVPRALTPAPPRPARAPETPQRRLGHAQALAAAGELSSAVAVIGEGSVLAEWELGAAVCIELGEVDRAAAYLRRVVKADPDHADANLRLALLGARHGWGEEVAAACAVLERRVAGLASDAELEGGLRAGHVRAVLAELAPAGERETGT